MKFQKELTILPADKFTNKVIGWNISELIGIGTYNPRYLGRPGTNIDLCRYASCEQPPAFPGSS